jgi:hypothetical protein
VIQQVPEWRLPVYAVEVGLLVSKESHQDRSFLRCRKVVPNGSHYSATSRGRLLGGRLRTANPELREAGLRPIPFLRPGW